MALLKMVVVEEATVTFDDKAKPTLGQQIDELMIRAADEGKLVQEIAFECTEEEWSKYARYTHSGVLSKPRKVS